MMKNELATGTKEAAGALTIERILLRRPKMRSMRKARKSLNIVMGTVEAPRKGVMMLVSTTMKAKQHQPSDSPSSSVRTCS